MKDPVMLLPRQPRLWIAGGLVSLTSLTGCYENDAPHRHHDPADLAAPTGTYVRGFQEIQTNKAASTAYVFFLDEWYMGGPLLGPHGIRHLLAVAERLPNTALQVQIQPGPDPIMNESRRLTLIKALLEKGIMDAEARVVLAFPQAEWLDGEEADRIYREMLSPHQNQWGGAYGGYGGGFGGGYGGYGGGFGGYGGGLGGYGGGLGGYGGGYGGYGGGYGRPFGY
jgi:hypothetical protein